jgi:hypothetical protein
MRAATSRGAHLTWRLALPLALTLAAALLLLNLLSGPGLLAAPPPRLAPDPDYAALALGLPPPPTWGVNLLAWSAALAPPEEAAELRAAYTAWREAAARELEGTGAFLYPFEALHVTVATPAPSTHAGHAGWSAQERALYARAWAGALAARPCAPARASYPLVLRAGASPLRLAPSGTAILLLDDPTGQVAALRACMRATAASLPPRVQAMLGAGGHKAPGEGFVHATVMRLALPRRAGMGDAEVEERWARAARAWERLVAPRVELLTARGAVLVEGMEAVNLAAPNRRDFVLWEGGSGGGGGQ